MSEQPTLVIFAKIPDDWELEFSFEPSDRTLDDLFAELESSYWTGFPRPNL